MELLLPQIEKLNIVRIEPQYLNGYHYYVEELLRKDLMGFNSSIINKGCPPVESLIEPKNNLLQFDKLVTTIQNYINATNRKNGNANRNIYLCLNVENDFAVRYVLEGISKAYRDETEKLKELIIKDAPNSEIMKQDRKVNSIANRYKYRVIMGDVFKKVEDERAEKKAREEIVQV